MNLFRPGPSRITFPRFLYPRLCYSSLYHPVLNAPSPRILTYIPRLVTRFVCREIGNSRRLCRSIRTRLITGCIAISAWKNADSWKMTVPAKRTLSSRILVRMDNREFDARTAAVSLCRAGSWRENKKRKKGKK